MTGIKKIVCGMVNCYLVTGEGGSVLVDTGEEPYKEKVLKACQGEEVKLIVLTHGHIDHIQNGAWLSRQLGVPIGMNEKDVELIENQFAQPLEGRGILGKALAAASLRKMRKNRIEGVPGGGGQPGRIRRQGKDPGAAGAYGRIHWTSGWQKGSDRGGYPDAYGVSWNSQYLWR